MTIHAMNAEEGGEVIGYMCAVDWECELGAASGGNRIFPCLEDAKEHLKCGESCGIVKVEVRYRSLALQGASEVAPFEEPAPQPAPMSVAEAARVQLHQLRPFWRKHGGDWYGPRVEHWNIPEDNMEAFFNEALRALASSEGE